MLKLTYKGHLDHTTVYARSGGVYFFSKENDYTLAPDSWDDFYEIILLNPDPHHRDFVIAEDPASKVNNRRIDLDTYVLDPMIVVRQEEINRKAALTKERTQHIDSYKRRVFERIADGTLWAYPEDLEKDASDFAEEQMRKSHPEMFKPKEEPEAEPVWEQVQKLKRK